MLDEIGRSIYEKGERISKEPAVGRGDNGFGVGDSASLSGFTDTDQISSWAKDAFAWAVTEKIINGKGGGVLDPKGTGTRAEVAQIVTNYDKIKGE